MLPALASTAANVTVYQQTPHWVLPKPNEELGYFGRTILRIPGAHKAHRKALHYSADMLLSPIPRSKIWRNIVERFAIRNLHKSVNDGELVQKLTPRYPLGSKRILFDNEFYPALNRSNVTFVTDPVISISEDCIETSSGALPADIIICATGFKASEFLVSISVHGRDGRSLNDDWKSGAEAFMGLAILAYPNLFLVAGPNSFNPAGSNPEMKELQIAYIMKCLRWKKDKNFQTIEVCQKAVSGYQDWLREKMSKTVWHYSEQGWYKHESGKVTNPWPDSIRVFARLLRTSPKQSFVKSKSRTI